MFIHFFLHLATKKACHIRPSDLNPVISTLPYAELIKVCQKYSLQIVFNVGKQKRSTGRCIGAFESLHQKGRIKMLFLAWRTGSMKVLFTVDTKTSVTALWVLKMNHRTRLLKLKMQLHSSGS